MIKLNMKIMNYLNFMIFPITYRPTSNAGDAIGDISVLNNNNPSVGLSGRGRTTSALTLADTLRII
jgi:hypothetical protein